FEGPQEQEKVKAQLAKYGSVPKRLWLNAMRSGVTNWTSCIVCLPSPRQGASRLFAISMSIGPCPHCGKTQLSTSNRLRWCRIPRDSAWLLHGVRQANRRKSPQCDAEYRSAHEVGKSALPRKFSASRPFVQSARRPSACQRNGPTGETDCARARQAR